MVIVYTTICMGAFLLKKVKGLYLWKFRLENSCILCAKKFGGSRWQQ